MKTHKCGLNEKDLQQVSILGHTVCELITEIE